VSRSVYGLLDCPGTVLTDQEFELIVGVADQPSPKVAGPDMTLPETSASTYTFSLQLLIFGFTLRDGESQRQTVEVSTDDPYFSVTLHLTPTALSGDRADRRIEVMYSVDGQPIGFALRYVTVTRSPSAQAAATSAGGENLSVPAAPTPADLTVAVSKGSSESELAWQFESPHDLDLPAESVTTDIGASPRDFARDLTNGLSACEGQLGVFGTIKGKGLDIAAATPTVFWDLLGQVAARTEGPPTIMFFTDEPYIPWELAYMDQPLDPGSGAPLILCAQARVGRWLKPRPKAQGTRVRPVQPPPTQVRVTAMGVVSGVYTEAGYERLKEAEAECQDLASQYGAKKIEANEAQVIECVAGNPAVEILHFAVHGQWDPGGPEDGLVLVDGTLSPDQVNAGELAARPLVFLNACQVGQGNQVLGDYAGIAANFLKAGASAVIAPLWAIDDATARSIALDFYQKVLLQGVPPAETLRLVRAGFQSKSVKQSSTYLAYQYFGDPQLELVPALPIPRKKGKPDATA
jgi:CHAT domain